VSGREAVVDNLLRWADHLEEWSVEVVEYVDAEPWVICDSRWRAIGKGSGPPVEWRVVEAHEFRDGKIVREIYGFGGVDEALEVLRAEGGFSVTTRDASERLELSQATGLDPHRNRQVSAFGYEPPSAARIRPVPGQTARAARVPAPLHQRARGPRRQARIVSRSRSKGGTQAGAR
jgi:hypothetical protein